MSDCPPTQSLVCMSTLSLSVSSITWGSKSGRPHTFCSERPLTGGGPPGLGNHLRTLLALAIEHIVEKGSSASISCPRLPPFLLIRVFLQGRNLRRLQEPALRESMPFQATFALAVGLRDILRHGEILNVPMSSIRWILYRLLGPVRLLATTTRSAAAGWAGNSSLAFTGSALGPRSTNSQERAEASLSGAAPGDVPSAALLTSLLSAGPSSWISTVGAAGGSSQSG